MAIKGGEVHLRRAGHTALFFTCLLDELPAILFIFRLKDETVMFLDFLEHDRFLQIFINLILTTKFNLLYTTQKTYFQILRF